MKKAASSGTSTPLASEGGAQVMQIRSEEVEASLQATVPSASLDTESALMREFGLADGLNAGESLNEGSLEQQEIAKQADSLLMATSDN